MDRVRLGAVSALVVLSLTTVVWLIPPTDAVNAPRGGVALARHLVRLGVIGAGESSDPVSINPIVAWADLLPGDVLVTRAPGSVYGYWSHATVYLGAGEVLGHDLLRGIFVEPLAGFSWYERVLVLRPHASAEQRAAVVEFSRSLVGRPFHLAAHPADPRQWSCAKAAMFAWASAGIAISDGRFWPTPDALAGGSTPIIADLRVERDR